MKTPTEHPPCSLLIGGSSPEGCRLAGEIVNALAEYDCGPPSNLFCHPKFWEEPGEKWAKVSNESLKNPAAKKGGFLPWCAHDQRVLKGGYLIEEGLRALLESSSDVPDFAEKLFSKRLILSAASSWAEATPENCYVAKAYLESVPGGQFLFVVESGYAAMGRLMKDGLSPQAAARIWVTTTAVVCATAKAFQSSGRVHLIRLEDLSEKPGPVIDSLVHFLWGADGETVEGGSSRLLKRSAGRRLISEHAMPQARLSSRHANYLLGTTVKPGALEGIDGAPSGAELMYELGYEKSVRAWEQVELSKAEQELLSLEAKFVSGFCEFENPPNAEMKRFWSFFRRREKVAVESEEAGVVFPITPVWEPAVAAEPDPETMSELACEPAGGELDFGAVIAFSERHEILDLSVRELIRLGERGYRVGVFLVCSSVEDFRFAAALREELGGIGVLIAPNNPLGSKWQAGVNFARKSRPKHLVIAGSDDLVSADFLCYAARVLSSDGLGRGIEFAAPASWFLLEIGSGGGRQGTLWELAYERSMLVPIGRGRVYASRLLDRIDWSLFDESLDWKLDDLGWARVCEAEANSILISSEQGMVLSVKGDWQALNSSEKILSAEAIQTRSCDFEKNELLLKNFDMDSRTLRERVSSSAKRWAEFAGQQVV